MTQHTSGTHSEDYRGQTPGVTAHVIVVGLDGSPASWDAFCWAAGEAARSNSRLIAVYATPLAAPFPSAGEGFDYDAAEQACRETAGQLADEAAQRASEIAVPLSFIRESGDIIRALTSVARSAGADLIVVGRSTKILHHLAGSAARRLVSRRDAPVTVVVP
jgi:nucleotide-binding universal stress UspA family protein